MYTATTKDDSMRNLKNTSQAIQDNVGETMHELRDTAEKAGRTARQYLDTARHELSHGAETVTTQIRQKPVQSSMIALGLGFVLGALFRR